MSLRAPQRRSLEILDRITEIVPPSKGADIQAAIETIKSEYPTVTDFEREFPSLCFALATGVGKTRLMGAFISYLHLVHRINHFFVLAPNLTIYNKLIADFTPNTPKYVFKGIAEFATEPPLMITGDNYESGVGIRWGVLPGMQLGVHVNIFNISKINSEVRGGKSPRIKRLSEYIGESYFEYLAGLDDLVLLMDESTEIVVHVNMLKEGWDVTNLYTIVPLRAANARILIEQSIGRGLRLPFGKRTGVSAVDRLSIVAHDRFQEIVDEANRPDSAIRLQQVILDPSTDLRGSRTVVAMSNLDRQTVTEKNRIPQMVFGGFGRCLYNVQKFQSDAERKLAVILDREALKWMKPANGQFQIFYKAGIDQREYVPDFLAERVPGIYLLEPKARNEMEDAEVLAKSDSAVTYCSRASQHSAATGGKPWKYLLIPHDEIAENMTLAGLASRYGSTG